LSRLILQNTKPKLTNYKMSTQKEEINNVQPKPGHPLIHESARGSPENHKKVGSGPETDSAGTTAVDNPTIVMPPSHGYPAVSSTNDSATRGNLPTAQHPAAAGPHPPIDATHHQEKIVPLPNPHTSTGTPSNRLRKLDRNHLSDIANMLSHSYSAANSFIVLPTTEEHDGHHPDDHSKPSGNSNQEKLVKEVKKDQEDLDKLNSRRDYIFKKIARALVKRDAAWGLFDPTNDHVVAAALLIPPSREYHQNPNDLRLEDPKVNEGHADHYVTLANLFTKKNPKQLVQLGPSLIKRIRIELRLFDTAMTVHQRPEMAFLYFFGDLATAGHNSQDPNGPADKSLSQDPHAKNTLQHNEAHYSQNVSTLLEELGKRYPMQVTTQRYRDNQRFALLLQNGFQEIDKVQGFHQRREEGEAHVWAPFLGHKETHHKEGPDMVYESCFLTLTKGIYPSLKNVENDVRGVVEQKESHGVISDPTTVLPPATVPNKQTDVNEHPIRAPPSQTTTAPSHVTADQAAAAKAQAVPVHHSENVHS
jgi:hypothetical protein